MDTFPLFNKLDSDSETILLAGAGGGYDIFCGLPLYFHLREQGKNVILGNLSFTAINYLDGKRLTPEMLEVSARKKERFDYFPERHLCEWLEKITGERTSIFCFERTGAAPIMRAYKALVSEHNVDTVILVDGGTDSLMRGDESGLGTPQEDIASIAAVDSLEIDHKYLVCLGFGVDHFHGICHFQFLEAVAHLTKLGAFLGSCSLLPGSKETDLYREACEFTFAKMPHHPSIVNSSIIAAIGGEYGNHHSNPRTAGSELWINPLMAMYWGFELGPVAERCLYLDQIRETESYAQLDAKIGAFRNSLEKVKPWEPIPA